MKKRWGGVAAPSVVAAVVLMGCSGSSAPSATIRVATPPTSTVAATVPAPVESAPATTVAADNGAGRDVAALRAATVRIETSGSFVSPTFGASEQLSLAGSGSGFVIDPSGMIVTNNHVVAGAAIVNVFFDGRSDAVPGRVVATSECSDLAVIDVAGDGLPALRWTEHGADTGTAVEAAGFPDGDPEFTLTAGIVSRSTADGATPWASITSMLQHDADLRPGNSGGPLVDSNGTVVGVNTAASDTGRFAIPAAVAEPVVAALMTGTDVDSIGVNALAVWDEATNESGVWVVSVQPGSAADKAGLLPGDVITRMKGLRVALDGTLADYCGVIRSAGTDVIPIEVKRGDGFLAGDVHGDGLQPTLSVINDSQQAAETPSAPRVTAPAAGVPYVEFTRVQDDTGTFAFDVPAAWSDHSTGEVSIGGAQRPSIAAARDVAALDASTTSAFDLPGVAAIVYDVGAPIDETFDVVVGSSSWASQCASSQRKSFDDGGYRGVLGVFAGCGKSSVVMSVAIERIGSGKWMLLNVFAPTLADIDAAARILETFDFLDAAGSTSAAPSDTATPAPTNDDAAAPATNETTKALAMIDEIGSPFSDAQAFEPMFIGDQVLQTYSHSETLDQARPWFASVAARLGCPAGSVTELPETKPGWGASLQLECNVVRGGGNYEVAVVLTSDPMGGATSVSVRAW